MRSSNVGLEADKVAGGIDEKGKLMCRNRLSEMWYAMRSLKLKLEPTW
jgi:hypothetical protein